MDSESFEILRLNSMRLADMALEQLSAEIDSVEVPVAAVLTEAEREAKALELLGQMDPADFTEAWQPGAEFDAQVREGIAQLERADWYEPNAAPAVDMAALDRLAAALPEHLPPLTRMLDESELAQWLPMYSAFDPVLHELIGMVLGAGGPKSSLEGASTY